MSRAPGPRDEGWGAGRTQSQKSCRKDPNRFPRGCLHFSLLYVYTENPFETERSEH
jgi:hypothetical protein